MVNASDCGSEDRGFESHHSPHFPSWDTTLGCRQAVRHQTLTLAFVGSSPAIPAMSEQGVLCSDFFRGWEFLLRQAGPIGIRPMRSCRPLPCRSKTDPCCRPGMENVKNDPLAQLAEQLPFKQWVWSSNLQRVTIAILNKALEKSSFSGVLLSLCICLRGSKNVTKRCFNKPNKKPPKMEKASS